MKPFFICLLFICQVSYAQSSRYGLKFNTIPQRWDEAIPLGNGWLGVLVWQKNDKLRMALDRVDLWDDRDMPEIDQLKFNWVMSQVDKKDYAPVQKLGDDPYGKYHAPTKLPGAAIEFDIQQLGSVVTDTLDIQKATNTIIFDSGVKFSTYVDATKPMGYFSFDGLKHQDITPQLVEPEYHKVKLEKDQDVLEISLSRLGYVKGIIRRSPGEIVFHQPTYDQNYYEVLVRWSRKGDKVEGSWTITNGQSAKNSAIKNTGNVAHINWWKNYWRKSSLNIPDKLLERQYVMDMYKFGSVTRADTPPISLQAIWTADNGSLPPWKGDFHYDLNVLMSYWPGYTANHLDLTASLPNWLWKVKEENRKWTRNYFGVEGINVPGVTTLSGKPMGGWIQYSLGPSTSAWIAHHFYLQWKYSMDETFLKEKCYPYLAEVEKYFRQMLIKDQQTGKYQLPLSSSPEYHDNSLRAWFKMNTNFDLTLIHNLYLRFAEVAKASGKASEEILHMEKQIAGLDVNETGLTIAPGTDLSFSHRHLSHLMAIYPLSLMKKEDSPSAVIMKNSMNRLEKLGTRNWYGFSFPWTAALYAQMGESDSAVVNLRKFATNFVSKNSFNLNGDQKGGQYCNYTDRPFTLETNFGFAEGIHQLLLQSEHGYVEIFPAVPKSWRNISFQNLRSQGAFLISAKKENGITRMVSINAEKGGLCRIKLPFKAIIWSGINKNHVTQKENNVFEFEMHKGQIVTLKNLDR
ncbi:glycosyl hydrolase family 95 catalytic domain-containing protein [Pedobacter sp. AW31-3R]|uniref:glycosyl hydrolase family 95 catalytic domain-containing protein n=1 Tax=Pedobacter sp. AW31-3R TaxID=3445781 RepID=UPI003F9EC919